MPQLDLLVLSPVATLGGTERVVFQVARGAKRAGRTVQGLFKHPIDRPEMAVWYENEGILIATTPHLKPLSPKRVLPEMLALRKEIRALSPRAVNLHNPGNTILATDVLAIRLAGVKRIVCSLHHPLDPESLPRSWRMSTRLAARLASTVVVTTPALQETVEAMGVASSAFTQIPLAVEPYPRSLTRAEARAELEIAEDRFVVGTLSRMEAYKRMDCVIRACAETQGFREHGLLLLAGGGPEEEELRKLAASILPDNHRFLGRVQDTSAFYQSLNVFALPSELEGFGLVYGEAGLAGVPSIGCDSGGTRFAIRDGESGYLLPVDRPMVLTETLNRLIGDAAICEKLGRAARNVAENELSLRRFESHYDQVLFP